MLEQIQSMPISSFMIDANLLKMLSTKGDLLDTHNDLEGILRESFQSAQDGKRHVSIVYPQTEENEKLIDIQRGKLKALKFKTYLDVYDNKYTLIVVW